MKTATSSQLLGTLLLASLAMLPPASAAAQDDAKEPAGKHQPQYEMTTYVVGLLRKGPTWTADESVPETKRILAGHMANIQKMADAGKLIVAGPFSDDTQLRGMFIFLVTSVDEAKAMVAADPGVQSGRFVFELHPWFAAKGLKVNPPK